MKRRKMEELIEKRLERYFGEGIIGGEQRYLASEILDVIENAGMLPPPCNEEDGWRTEHFDNYKWESE